MSDLPLLLDLLLSKNPEPSNDTGSSSEGPIKLSSFVLPPPPTPPRSVDHPKPPLENTEALLDFLQVPDNCTFLGESSSSSSFGFDIPPLSTNTGRLSSSTSNSSQGRLSTTVSAYNPGRLNSSSKGILASSPSSSRGGGLSQALSRAGIASSPSSARGGLASSPSSGRGGLTSSPSTIKAGNVSTTPSKLFPPMAVQTYNSDNITDILNSLQKKEQLKVQTHATSSQSDFPEFDQSRASLAEKSSSKVFSSSSDVPVQVSSSSSILGPQKDAEVKIQPYLSRLVPKIPAKNEAPDVNISFQIQVPPKWENEIIYDINKNTIQGLLDAAPPFTMIVFPQGSYTEEVRISKPVALTCNGKVKWMGKGLGNVIECAAEYVLIEGLEICQTVSHSGGGIFVKSGYTFLNKVIVESELTNSLYVYGTASLQCEQSHFSKSEHVTAVISSNATALFSKCVFTKSGGYGASCSDDAQVIFENCIFKENSSCGLSSVGRSHVITTGCTFDSNVYSGYECCSKGLHLIQKCLVQNHKQTGITLQGEVIAVIKESKFIKNQLACLKAYMNSLGFCFKNHFEDSASNMILLAHENALLQLEDDEFTGSCNAAIASFDQGEINANRIKVNNVKGSGVICYNAGKCVISDSEFNEIQRCGIHARGNSEIKINGCKLRNIGESGFSIQGGVEGSIKSTIVQNAGHSPTPGQGGISISDNQASIELQGLEVSHCNNYGISCDKSQVYISDTKLFENGMCNIAMNGENTKVFVRNLNSFGAKETSVQVHSQAEVHVYDSELHDNLRFGFVARDSKITVRDTKVITNAECGFNIFGGSEATIENCFISENGRCGFQIHQPKTNVNVIDSKITDHTKGASFLVVDNSNLTCTRCTLYNSMQNHVQASQNAQIVLDACDLSKTTCGNCLQLQNCRTSVINGTVIHDESKAGILVASGGILEVKGSTIRSCGVCGINVMDGGAIEVLNSLLEKNGKLGIQVMAGAKADIQDSIIRGHSQVGILICSGSETTEINNTFEENVHGSVYRDQK